MRPFHDNDGKFTSLHVVHRTDNGCKFIGDFGSMSLDFCTGLLRFHDGVTPGGLFVLPMVKNCAGNLPIVPVAPPAEITMPANAGNFCVQHNFGVKPIVQVMDSADGEVDQGNVIIDHISSNEFCIIANAPHPAFTIIYRF